MLMYSCIVAGFFDEPFELGQWPCIDGVHWMRRSLCLHWFAKDWMRRYRGPLYVMAGLYIVFLGLLRSIRSCSSSLPEGP